MVRKTSTLYKILAGIISIFVVFSISYYFACNVENNVEKMTGGNAADTLADYIDVVYYINLDIRTDRNAEFLLEMEKMNIPENKIVRISAVHEKERGHLGCSLSHIKTLTQFLETDHQTCIVFEDDFEFTEPPDVVNSAFQELIDNNINFDVCMLSGNVYETSPIAEYPFIRKAQKVLTTSGYMLSKSFAPTLLENFKEGAKLLEKSYDERIDIKKKDPSQYNYSGEYAIDQYWTALQEDNKWYIFQPKLGSQRQSYSDIMENNVRYSV